MFLKQPDIKIVFFLSDLISHISEANAFLIAGSDCIQVFGLAGPAPSCISAIRVILGDH